MNFYRMFATLLQQIKKSRRNKRSEFTEYVKKKKKNVYRLREITSQLRGFCVQQVLWFDNYLIWWFRSVQIKEQTEEKNRVNLCKQFQPANAKNNIYSVLRGVLKTLVECFCQKYNVPFFSFSPQVLLYHPI